MGFDMASSEDDFVHFKRIISTVSYPGLITKDPTTYIRSQLKHCGRLADNALYIITSQNSLKGPKHEIFESRFFTEIRPVRIGDLGTGEKK